MRDTQRMHDVERHESQRRQRGNRGGSEPRRGLEQEQIERRHIPQRREAAKVIIGCLHQPVGEIERAGDDNDDAERDCGHGGQESARRQRIGRHEDVVENVDHEIEHVAGPARQHFGDPQPPREGAVDAVDEERDAEPDEHLRPIRTHRGEKREQRAAGAAGGEDMDREGRRGSGRAVFLGCSWVHQLSLHVKSKSVRQCLCHCSCFDHKSVRLRSAAKKLVEDVKSRGNAFTAEVAVIGGGPAGLVSAIALAAAGADTLLVAPPAEPDHRTTALLVEFGHRAGNAWRLAGVPAARRAAEKTSHRRRHAAAIARARGLFRCRGDRA